MKISVFGLGYVGTVAMGCLAQLGHDVIGVDVNTTKVKFVNDGKAPILEAEIGDLLRAAHDRGAIRATQDIEAAVRETQISFICVGTPATTNGQLDMTNVFRVASDIGEALSKKETFHVIAIRSTVMPGTTGRMGQLIAERSGKRPLLDFAVVCNPEFLREGTAVRDFFCPPYTVIGTTSTRAADLMREVYRGVPAPTENVDVAVAEMIKCVSNTFHALKVTFANEVGNICAKIGVDSQALMRVFCLDTKLNLSPYYLQPGFAYGGSCLPKDLKALRSLAHDSYIQCPIIENIEVSNQLQKDNVLEQIISFGKRRIAFLGLAFKSGTDDLRYSPIVDVIEPLIGKGFEVRVFDQNVHLAKLVGANRDFILNRIPYISQFISNDPREVIDFGEVVVVVNRDDGFGSIVSSLCQDKIVYDLANLEPKRIQKLRQYRRIGSE